ncbi:helix-turn-helix domain-containing protein [Actinacidiphila yeochonensis]|uniref:helix-turn-helix domain-containing protein n=1 Tax=Actinacidiphila yeochonensis TaxID=89050 RepID=UPI00056D0A36|nr:helix-turn-helix transcriptional regulator [Actinacidiphila yeochonensis]
MGAVSGEERQDGARFLGREIRIARERRGLTQQQIGDEAGYERSYVTHVEGGKRLASLPFAESCDRLFETTGYFVRLREEMSERGHPGWFVPYIKLEQQATEICDYSNSFIMGMLQTPAYAEATLRMFHPRDDEEQIKARVAARLGRHDVMARDAPPLLWVVLHEAVLRTLVGGPAVMAEQLEYLCAEAASPHVVIQVLPFSAGAPAASLPFILLTLEGGESVLYTESREGGHVNDSAAAVASARATYDWLRAAALSPDASLHFIRGIAEEYVR